MQAVTGESYIFFASDTDDIFIEVSFLIFLQRVIKWLLSLGAKTMYQHSITFVSFLIWAREPHGNWHNGMQESANQFTSHRGKLNVPLDPLLGLEMGLLILCSCQKKSSDVRITYVWQEILSKFSLSIDDIGTSDYLDKCFFEQGTAGDEYIAQKMHSISHLVV